MSFAGKTCGDLTRLNYTGIKGKEEISIIKT